MLQFRWKWKVVGLRTFQEDLQRQKAGKPEAMRDTVQQGQGAEARSKIPSVRRASAHDSVTHWRLQWAAKVERKGKETLEKHLFKSTFCSPWQRSARIPVQRCSPDPDWVSLHGLRPRSTGATIKSSGSV